MFDTHCHLNFSRFKKNYKEVIARARQNGVESMVVVGTDIESSKKAISIAQSENLYAAIGVHPHHALFYLQNADSNYVDDLKTLEDLLKNKEVIAVGEIGLDKHEYEETKYRDYSITDTFLKIQKELFIKQLEMAQKNNKTVIIHNREAINELVLIISDFSKALKHRCVLHCCEPSQILLKLSLENNFFIGVDGDITYSSEKQNFIREVPLELLVLETDSPFLLPEPYRTKREFPCEPYHVRFVDQEVANLKKIDVEKVVNVTTENARRLFQLT